MTEVNLTKYIRLPKFLYTEKYITNVLKFLAPGNYSIGKQEIRITGCDLVMSTYSDLIPTLPEEKVRSLANSIELTETNTAGFVFTWLYINGVLDQLLTDNELISYNFDKFMQGNYTIYELLELTSWIDYFGITTDIDNRIVGVIAGIRSFYGVDKELLSMVSSKAKSRYWIDPWRYSNYGELAHNLKYSLGEKSEYLDELKIKDLIGMIERTWDPFKLDSDRNRRLARQFIDYQLKSANNGKMLFGNTEIMEKFAEELNIKINWKLNKIL